MFKYDMALEFIAPNIKVLAYSRELQTALDSFNEKSAAAKNKKTISRMVLNRSSISLTLESKVPLEVPGRSLQTFVRGFLNTLTYEQREYFVRDGRVFRTISTEVSEEEPPVYVGDKLRLVRKIVEMLTDEENGNKFAEKLEEFLEGQKNPV